MCEFYLLAGTYGSMKAKIDVKQKIEIAQLPLKRVPNIHFAFDLHVSTAKKMLAPLDDINFQLFYRLQTIQTNTKLSYFKVTRKNLF